MAGQSVKPIVLRVLAAVCFFIALGALLSTCQTARDAVQLYQFWNAFVVVIVINVIGGIYNLIVLCIPEGSQLWKTVIVLDVMVDMLVSASIGAGWATYSQIRGGCSTCVQFPFLCSRVLGALIVSTVGFSISILLLISILHVCVDPFLVGY